MFFNALSEKQEFFLTSWRIYLYIYIYLFMHVYISARDYFLDVALSFRDRVRIGPPRCVRRLRSASLLTNGCGEISCEGNLCVFKKK